MPRLIVLLVVALLAACDAGDRAEPERSVGEAERPAAEPLTEARRASLCAEIHNQYECSGVVEAHLLERGAPGVARRGDTLTLALEDGGTRVLADHGTDADVTYYTYDGRLDRIGYHLVQVHYYEGGAHLLIDAATGEETRVAGRPAVSPDGERIAIASFGGVAGYVPDLLQIRRVADALPVEWELEPDDWGAGSPRWEDPTTVRFTKWLICEPGRTCEEEAVLRLQDGEWTIVDADGAGNAT